MLKSDADGHGRADDFGSGHQELVQEGLVHSPHVMVRVRQPRQGNSKGRGL